MRNGTGLSLYLLQVHPPKRLCLSRCRSCLLLWDTRSGTGPVCRVEDAHGAGRDVQAVDWSRHDEHLLVTGDEQGSIKIWDLRMPEEGPWEAHEVAAATEHKGGVVR